MLTKGWIGDDAWGVPKAFPEGGVGPIKHRPPGSAPKAYCGPKNQSQIPKSRRMMEFDPWNLEA